MKDILKLVRRCVCYLRRSRQDIVKEKRTGEDTLKNQEVLMTGYMNSIEIEYDVFKEIGSGDKISTRPIFQKILAFIKEGKYNAIAVREISRLGRGSFADNGIIYELYLNGLIIITPYRIYDPNNPTDARLVRFELFFSREEFELTKERLCIGKYTSAAEGNWPSSYAPYGYRHNRKTMHLVVHKAEAEVVILIYTIFVYGLKVDDVVKDVSYQAISSYLSRMGVPPPRGGPSWKQCSVKKILTNPAYKGEVVYKKTKRVNNKSVLRPPEEWIVAKDAHERIVEQELWDKAQEKILKNRVPPTKLDFSPSELASLIICTSCGRKLIRQCSTQHYCSYQA